MVIGGEAGTEGEHGGNSRNVQDAAEFFPDPAWESLHEALPPQKRLQWDVALAPSSLTGLSGQSRAKDALLKWWGAMRSAADLAVPSCALLHGPPGTGKTLMVNLAAAMYGYRVVCFDLERGKSAAEEALGLLKQSSLQTCEDQRPVALLLEHVDDQDARISGIAREIQKRWAVAVHEAAAPRSVLLFTCEDAWDSRMETLRGKPKAPLAHVVHFPSLALPEMKVALRAACARGDVAVTAEEQSALLEACSGRMRSALLSLQFLRSGDKSLTPEALRLDTLLSARDTAQAALSRGARLEHAAADVEGVIVALHAALPDAAEFGEEQVALRRKELASGRAEALHSLEAESMDALARSLDALSQFDVEEGSEERKCKTFPHLGAYLAAEGFGAPMRQMRARRNLSKVPVNMRSAWAACPEYFVRKGQASKQFKSGREQHEARTLAGCETAATSAAKDGSRTILLPPHIQSLGHVYPSRDELGDYCALFPRPWVRTNDAKHF